MVTPWDGEVEMDLAIKQVAPEVAKEIHNRAIEQAAKIAECSETNITKLIAEDIRSLKK